MLCLSGWLIAAVALMGCAETAAFQQTFTGGSLSLIPPRATVAIFSGSRRCDFVKAAAMREGSMEPKVEHGAKGILARAKGMAVKGGGALLLAFVAYNVALGALRTIGFWIGSVALAVSAFFAWRLIKGGKKDSS